MLAARAGGLPLQPERGQLNEPEPGVGGRPLFQPGHPRVDQPLLLTPEGDQDDIPLTGQAGGSATSRPPRSRAASCGNDTPFII